MRGEIFMKYLTERVGDGGQLHKGIRLGMGGDLREDIRRDIREGIDRRNKSCFSYQYFNKLKLEYSTCKS